MSVQYKFKEHRIKNAKLCEIKLEVARLLQLEAQALSEWE